MKSTESHRKSGVLPKSELRARGLIPDIRRLKKGPVAIVECIEEIPCNPCVDACPRGAITIAGNLTNPPRVDFERCNGCGTCVFRCPGLAIFVVHYRYTPQEAAVSIPYEFLPRPEPGSRVTALDRRGRRVCSGRVVRVLDGKAQNGCAVVTVAVPRRFWNDVRGIALKRG